MVKKLTVLSIALAFAFILFVAWQINTKTPFDIDPVTGLTPDPISAYLSPEESMKTIQLAEGYHLELVASEPMIKEPVAIAWDGNGKLYVAEMTTYMQDADATGEQVPVSRISLLQDTNNDGKMDKSTVFVDSLLLPRMIQCVNHELLVNETNTIKIHSYTDTNGDGKADKKKLVYDNEKYVISDQNMEHQRSGLDWNIDNYMYVTYEPARFRYINGKMIVDSIVSGGTGQWGLTHDNYGKLFHSSAGGENPAYGFQISPVYGRLEFPDQYSAEFQEVWPIIQTPDVQGGEKRLRPDNTLNHFTGCTGQSIFRGDNLPKDLVGDYILCEPVARLIRRAKVTNVKGKTMLTNAYEKKEFIASSDMNFRPVNSATGPDGNLYIVDMHRGIIQQGNWTRPGSFLRKKIDSIGLAKNTGHGRIYRVVHDGFKRGPQPRMLDESSKQLVSYLSHGNGWWRDNAQKELVLRRDKSVVPALKLMALKQTPNSEAAALGRIHALWTLDGLQAIDKTTLLQALNDKDAQVRKTAVWISESYIKQSDVSILNKLRQLKADPSHDVRLQVLLSLSRGKASVVQPIVQQILAANEDNPMFTATKNALDRAEDQKTYGRKLAHISMPDRNIVMGGRAIFRSLCASCHGPDGKGIVTAGAPMVAPPLVGSKRLTADDKTSAVRILLHGLTGPVDGKTYSSVMPPMGSNNDRWISSVVSYIRFDMGGKAASRPANDFIVRPEEVRKIRQQDSTRTNPWTLAEIEARKKVDR